jgi:hypothetical protein
MYYSNAEKKAWGLISSSDTQRLGSDSQLLFGSCPLTLNPIVEAVVTPSGHMYERESILEYLLKRTKELKDQQKQYEDQQVSIRILSFNHIIILYYYFTILMYICMYVCM